MDLTSFYLSPAGPLSSALASLQVLSHAYPVLVAELHPVASLAEVLVLPAKDHVHRLYLPNVVVALYRLLADDASQVFHHQNTPIKYNV